MGLAAVTTAPGTIELQRVDALPLGPDDARLRVEVAGVCGTDLHLLDGSLPADLPLVQGHEMSAVVEELPDRYSGSLRPGDRVAVAPVIACGACYPCRVGRRNTCQRMSAVGVHRPGGFQETVWVPVDHCHPTGTLTAEAAALCETLSVSHRAIERTAVGPGERVLVLGAGPIGLGALLAAVEAGAEVMVLDQHDSRLALASELGAAEVVRGLDRLPAAVADWTDGDGAAVVVEATGAPAVAAAAFDVVAVAGRIAMVGVSQQPVSVNQRLFTSKELDVVGSRSTLDFPAAVELVRRHEEAVLRLVSHVAPLTGAAEALALAAARPDEVTKTLLRIS